MQKQYKQIGKLDKDSLKDTDGSQNLEGWEFFV